VRLSFFFFFFFLVCVPPSVLFISWRLWDIYRQRESTFFDFAFLFYFRHSKDFVGYQGRESRGSSDTTGTSCKLLDNFEERLVVLGGGGNMRITSAGSIIAARLGEILHPSTV